MMLTAWSEGVGSNWVGFMGMDQVKPLRRIPDELHVLAIVPFGFPAKPIGKGKKNRKPLSEVAHLQELWPAVSVSRNCDEEACSRLISIRRSCARSTFLQDRFGVDRDLNPVADDDPTSL